MGVTVAIKRLHAQGVGGQWDGDAFTGAFLREARCLKACRGHPCLVELRAAHLDPTGDGAFLVTEGIDRSLVEDDALPLVPAPHAAWVARILQEPEPTGQDIHPYEQNSGVDPWVLQQPAVLQGTEEESPCCESDVVAGQELETLTAADYLHEMDQLRAKSSDVDKMSLQDGDASCLATCSTGDIEDDSFRASYSYDVEGIGEDAGAFTSCVGTRWFRAPELLYGSTNYGLEIDLWSLGCILAELLNLEPIFPGISDIDQISRVISVLGDITEETFPGCSNLPDYNKIFFSKVQKPTGLEACLPNKSPSEVSIIKKLICYDPEKRVSAADLLNDPYFTEEPLPVPIGGLQVPASKDEDDSSMEEWGNYRDGATDSDFDEFGSMDVTETEKGFSIRFS
nr:unnamed protein product [Digitaria exilis]